MHVRCLTDRDFELRSRYGRIYGLFFVLSCVLRRIDPPLKKSYRIPKGFTVWKINSESKQRRVSTHDD
jgi:hypothetical protein